MNTQTKQNPIVSNSIFAVLFAIPFYFMVSNYSDTNNKLAQTNLRLIKSSQITQTSVEKLNTDRVIYAQSILYQQFGFVFYIVCAAGSYFFFIIKTH